VDVVVIGGGAAGFFGAIACAQAAPQLRVVLLEASRTPLTKVRISGGGRCNVTHACFDPAQLVQHYPRGGRALRGAFSRFQPRDTIAWFGDRHIRLKTEADGRMFPISDQSETIVRGLLETAQQAGVKLRLGVAVQSVARTSQGFQLSLKSREVIKGDRLLLATGSNPRGYQLAQSLGHQIEPPVPSLFTFQVPEPSLHELAGVAVEPVQVTLRVPDHKPLQQTGPVLITHWGLSGPAVLKLSAWGARLLHGCGYRAQVQINWLLGQSPEQVRQTLQQAKEEQARRAIASHCPFELPRRLWQYLMQRAKIADDTRWAHLSKQGLHRLVQELTQGQFELAGKGVFKEEFVTCGGVRLKEVDFKTMESRRCPGLYFAGEVLDIDGVTGGFNFQSAWTTGWIAGRAIAQSLSGGNF